MAKTTVDPKYMITMQNKQFVQYPGLLDAAHMTGKLQAIETQLLQAPMDINNMTAIVSAKVTLDGQIFMGIGDANKENVGPLIGKHIIRMAETRSKARALRDALNISECSFEELELEQPDNKPPHNDAAATAEKTFGGMSGQTPPEEPKKPAADRITEKQAKRMFAISGGRELVVRTVLNNHGYVHTTDVTRNEYEVICAEIEKLAEKLAREGATA